MIVTGVDDFDDAQPAFAHIRDVINDTWERRSEITPQEQPRLRASALEVFKSLPGTNCGDCGETTCMAFAVKLAAGQARLEDCTPLAESAREHLQAILGEAG
jgi:ArsR family metal-binding transcriptional regulator